MGGGEGASEGDLEAPGAGCALSSGLLFPAGGHAARPEPRGTPGPPQQPAAAPCFLNVSRAPSPAPSQASSGRLEHPGGLAGLRLPPGNTPQPRTLGRCSAQDSSGMERELRRTAHGRRPTQPWRSPGPLWSPLPTGVHSGRRPAAPGTRPHPWGFALPCSLSPSRAVCPSRRTFFQAPFPPRLAGPGAVGVAPM